jgi:hypothetical protein
MPQAPPGLQDEAVLALKEYAPPDVFEAKVEIFFLIRRLPQAGQLTSSIAWTLRTNSSNG